MRNERQYYIYIMASKRNGTLYTGITNDLIRRVYEHKNGLGSAFTKKYKVFNLVYYDSCGDVRDVIEFEKRLKKWKRSWKLKIIEIMNPEWKDLYYTLC